MENFLPPKNLLTKTDAGDPLFYHYIPLIGYVFKKRLVNTLSLLADNYENLLEIGFGSGLLLPELARRSNNLYGVDVHEMIPAVRKMLDSLNIRADLRRISALDLPFADDFFDAAVSVSAFEHLKPVELDKAFLELKRTLKKGGVAVISFPVRNIITDVFFQTLGWNSKEWNPRIMHPSSHNDIIVAAKKQLRVEKILVFPKFLPIDLSLYCSIICHND